MVDDLNFPKRRPVPSWDGILPESGLVAGIDEVGRGAWAGPVVAAAVIMPYGLMIGGLGDSKLVTARRRRLLDREIKRCALAIGVGWVMPNELDRVGLAEAIRLSGQRALASLELLPDRVILDGSHDYLAAANSTAIVKADATVVPVAAASIIAKEARDRYMRQLGRRYPAYGFERHVGYGSAVHRGAMASNGLCPEHRRSFRPVKAMVA